jgi:acyl-CoA thioester hydrolase
VDGIEVWRGGVNTWECDEMGHLNVRFYGARSMEGLVGLAAAIGLPDAFKPNSGSTLILREQHIRFMREALSRAPLHMMAGVLEVGETTLRIAQILYHSRTGEISACFHSLVEHCTATDLRPFPWSEETRRRAQALTIDVPAKAAPRSVSLEGASCRPTLAHAETMNLVHMATGAFGPGDVDVFGRVRAETFMGRISDNIPRLAGDARQAAATQTGTRIGGAVLEYRLIHHAWPGAGDRFLARSGIAEVAEKHQRLVHWVFDAGTGQALVTAEAVAISLDLDARKVIALTPEARAQMQERVIPGLAI